MATGLGISEIELRRRCSKHHVPCPSPGYWARVVRGDLFERPPLRPVTDPSLELVDLAIQPRPIAAPNTPASDEPDAPSEQDTVAPQDKPGSQDHSEVSSAPDRPINLHSPPHAAIAATVKALRKANPDDHGAVSAIGPGLLGVVAHMGSIDRIASIITALVSALDAEGLALIADERRMKVAVGEDDVKFTLTERTKRQKHVVTPAEQQAYERRLKRRQQAADRRDWDLYWTLPYEKPWPEHDTIYTGHLVLSIDGWSRGLRKNWADGKTQRLEIIMPSIVSGLRAVLEHIRADREDRERKERKDTELARRRELAKRRVEREEARVAHLRELVRMQKEAADIRSWLDSLSIAQDDALSSELERMVRWAEERLAKLKSQTSVDAAAARISGAALFPEVDELHDPEGDPPEGRSYW